MFSTISIFACKVNKFITKTSHIVLKTCPYLFEKWAVLHTKTIGIKNPVDKA